MLAAGADALLRGRRAHVRALVEAEEDVLELVHPGVREQQRRVVAGHDRARGDDRVALRLEELQERRADLGGFHRRAFGGGGIARRRPAKSLKDIGMGRRLSGTSPARRARRRRDAGSCALAFVVRRGTAPAGAVARSSPARRGSAAGAGGGERERAAQQPLRPRCRPADSGRCRAATATERSIAPTLNGASSAATSLVADALGVGGERGSSRAGRHRRRRRSPRRRRSRELRRAGGRRSCAARRRQSAASAPPPLGRSPSMRNAEHRHRRRLALAQREQLAEMLDELLAVRQAGHRIGRVRRWRAARCAAPALDREAEPPPARRARPARRDR